MTKQIEDILNLPRLDEALAVLEEDGGNEVVESEGMEDEEPETTLEEDDPDSAAKFAELLEQNKNLELALRDQEGLEEHQREMNEVYQQAMKAHKELLDLGFNVESKHAGQIFNPSVAFLKTAIDASKSKADQKLKLLKSRMDREKLDMELRLAAGNTVDATANGDGTPQQQSAGVFEHRQLLERLRNKTPGNK